MTDTPLTGTASLNWFDQETAAKPAPPNDPTLAIGGRTQGLTAPIFGPASDTAVTSDQAQRQQQRDTNSPLPLP